MSRKHRIQEEKNRKQPQKQKKTTPQSMETLDEKQIEILCNSTWCPYAYLPYGLWYMY